MIANWTLSIISCYLACFAHRFSSYVAFFSRTSAGSLPRARARVLAWLMPQGSVLLLGLIGIEGARIFREICFVATIRLAKTKISTFVQLFAIADSLPSSARRKWAAVRPICRFFGLHSRFDAPRQSAIAKSCNFGRISVLGTRIGPMLVSRAGCPWRSAFVDDLGSVLPPLVSGFFACRICGRSCPHPIAAPAALRYHDKNCFKRALKCILRSKQAGKGTQHNKEG